MSEIERTIAKELAKLPEAVQDKFLLMAQGAAVAVECAREEKAEAAAAGRPYSPESGAAPRAGLLEQSGETSLPNRNSTFRFGEEGPGQSSSIAANAAMRSIVPRPDDGGAA